MEHLTFNEVTQRNEHNLRLYVTMKCLLLVMFLNPTYLCGDCEIDISGEIAEPEADICCSPVLLVCFTIAHNGMSSSTYAYSTWYQFTTMAGAKSHRKRNFALIEPAELRFSNEAAAQCFWQ
ncbi:unnamed protein product [Cylicostephanus goldi]|uniref:Uncharacterized protein n=1 Tax=Cylicostephanus goldi TaxID=71465 RepID=A0A3P6R7C2_CYLGO|nr:unnamed protein product [Cylicostephanus goldi]